MAKKTNGIDWSKEHLKEHLTDPRRFLWLPDTVAKLAVWMGLEQGMTAVDAGCGLAFLGYTYWPYFGKGGRYYGVDLSPKLAREASENSAEWAKGGRVYFAAGDANHLPFPDSFADLVMCQTLLMYQQDPSKTLREMVRVAKPGGLVMCKERDNLSLSLAVPRDSLPELDIEEQLLSNKVAILVYRGRIQMGRGDYGIGPQIPWMMQQLGLVDIDIRLNDRVDFLQPPYEGEIQQHRLRAARKALENEENEKFWMKRALEEFLAGGGTREEFERYQKIYEKNNPILKKQLEEGTYRSCSGWFFYVIRGRKAK